MMLTFENFTNERKTIIEINIIKYKYFYKFHLGLKFQVLLPLHTIISIAFRK